MGKFKYKYESIKKVKEAFEKKAQKEVSVIELEIKKKENDILKIEETIKASRLNLKNKKVSVSSIQFNKNYIEDLKAKIENIKKEILELEEKKSQKINELIKKTKEVKMFDTLKDIYQNDYNEDEKRKEMIFLDEIASQKFSRGKSE